MIQVRNNRTGKLENIEDGGLPDLLNSGEYSILKGQELEFEDNDGQRRIVPSDQVFDAIDAGFKHVSQKQVQKEEQLDIASEEPFKAAGAGLLRGVSLGLSDQILTSTGITSPEKLKALEEANPIVSGASEITGAIAPAFFTGGTSVGARLLSATPAALAERAGVAAAAKFAPSITGKILSKTASNITKEVVDKAVKIGTGSAVEGAFFGVGDVISEDALGDAEFNAETALAGMGQGALIGGIFGAAAGGTFGMVGEGAKAIKRQYTETMKKVFSGIEDKQIQKDVLTRLSNEESAEEIMKKLGANADEVADKIELEKAAEALAVPLTPGMKEGGVFAELEGSLAKEPSVGGILTRKEIKKTYDALDNIQNLIVKDAADVDKSTIGLQAKSGVKAKISEELEPGSLLYKEIEDRAANLPITESLRKRFKTELKKLPFVDVFEQGQRFINLVDNLDTYSKVSKYRTFIGNELSKSQRAGDGNAVEFFGQLYDNLTTLRTNAIKYNLKAAPFVSKDKQITNLLEAQEMADGIWRSTHEKYQFLGDYLGIKTKNMSNLLNRLEDVDVLPLADKLLNLKKIEDIEKFQLYFPEVADLARARILNNIKKRSSRTGVFSPKVFKAELNKLEESQLKLLAPHLTDPKKLIADYSKIVDNLPPNMNPSDTSVNISFQNMFELAYQSKEMFRYMVYRSGPKGMLGQMTKYIPTNAALEKAVNQGKINISDSVENFFKKSAALSTKAINRTITGQDLSEDDVKEIEKKVEYYQQDPQEIIQVYNKNNKALYESAPKTAGALGGKIMDAAAFLSTKVPKKQITPFNDETISRSELMKFKNYVDAVEKPYKVMNSIASGYIAPEYMEAFRAVYPRMAAEIQKEFAERLPEFNKKLTEKQKANLSVILGLDTRKAFTPTGFNMLQQFSGMQIKKEIQNMQPQRRVSSVGAKNIKSSTREQSGLDKVLYRT
jgi:hypothetical protein